MHEWQLLGDEESAKRLRDQHALLRVCRHLSINAKHFKARERKSKSGEVVLSPVAGTHQASVFQLGGAASPREPLPRRPEFYIELSPTESVELGAAEFSALELAGMVVRFWRERLDPTLPPRPRHPLEGMDLSSLAQEDKGAGMPPPPTPPTG